MAEDLLETIGQLFGPSAAASPCGHLRRRAARRDHRRRRRDGDLDGPDLAADHASLWLRPPRSPLGVIAASGTLAQIIPPSLVLIVLADQLGRSVGDMYKAAILPGLLLAGLYMPFMCSSSSMLKPGSAPACRRSARHRENRRCRRALAVRAGGDVAAPHVIAIRKAPLISGDRRRRSSPDGVGLMSYRVRRSPSSTGSLQAAARCPSSPSRVTFVMVPPLAAHLSRARHDPPRRCDADRGRRHGRRRSDVHGAGPLSEATDASTPSVSGGRTRR